MKILLLVFIAILLTACNPDLQVNHFQASPVIKVQTQVMQATTLQGEMQVFGVVESAKKIDLNVEFSAPVEKVLVDEGQTVRRQQPLLILDTDKLSLTLKQTQQVLAQARTQKENAALRFGRVKQLKNRDTISQQQYDEAGFALDEATARIRELTAQLQIIERDLENRVVRSPVDAIVDRRHIEAGQSITAYQPLITLQAIESYKVSVFVGEHHLPYLQVGNHGRIETVAGTFESKIYSISADSDEQTGNYEIKLLLNGESNRLRPGMTAEVRLMSSVIPGQLVVPESALFAWQGQHVVYTVENGRAQRHPVEVAIGFDDRLIIDSGLNVDDEVVIAGANQLTQDSLVEIANE